MPDANRSITEELRQIFAEEVVAPKQAILAERLYQLLHVQAFDEPEWTVDLHLKGADARMQEATIAGQRMNAAGAALTVNEARSEIGYSDLDGPAGNMLVAEALGRTASGSSDESPAAGEDAEVEAARRDQRAADLGYSITDRADADD
jgi:hypothetical protein